MNVHSISLKGLRDQNEDHHNIIINSNGQYRKNKNIDFFAIYDGHGGGEVSEYVKNNLPQYFIDKRITYPLSKRYIVNVYDHIQKSLSKYKFSQYSGSTGLVVILFNHGKNSYLNVMNNGDCRSILCRDNLALPLTKDHKPHWPEETHRIEQLGGKILWDGHGDWRILNLSVSRAFGDLDSVPYVTHRPDIYRYPLDKKDKFIVMACDGLWDVLKNDEVVNYILNNCYDNTLTTRVNKQFNVAKGLAEYALKKGSTDNITIIIIFLR